MWKVWPQSTNPKCPENKRENKSEKEQNTRKNFLIGLAINVVRNAKGLVIVINWN